VNTICHTGTVIQIYNVNFILLIHSITFHLNLFPAYQTDYKQKH